MKAHLRVTESHTFCSFHRQKPKIRNVWGASWQLFVQWNMHTHCNKPKKLTLVNIMVNHQSPYHSRALSIIIVIIINIIIIIIITIIIIGIIIIHPTLSQREVRTSKLPPCKVKKYPIKKYYFMGKSSNFRVTWPVPRTIPLSKKLLVSG